MDNKKLYVGNISYGASDDDLANFFAEVGTVESATIITDRMSGRSKGFGFVEMSSAEEAAAAIEQLDGKELDGRPVTVKEARPQKPREDRNW